MHPLIVAAIAELRLNEARDSAAALSRARAARCPRPAGTIRRRRRLIRASLVALRHPGAI
jgi:hypothetical protein